MFVTAKRFEVRALREQGLPVSAVAELAAVSQSSVVLWTRDIRLTANQNEANAKRAQQMRGRACRELHRRRRLRFQGEGRARARAGDPTHVAGCMLYWAEGAKHRNTVQMANSDAALMEFFVQFLRSCFSLTSDDLTFSVNAYTNNGLDIDEIELFWMYRLGLSRRCARKHMTNHYPTSSSGQKRAKLPHGVCSIKVKRSTWLIQHIYGAIQEYSGMDQPAWLDGPPRKPKP